jgi:ribonuclease HII
VLEQPTKVTKPKKILKAEWRRLQNLVIYENAARQKGFQSIAGIDEAGRGPLAGPVVAAACIIPPDLFFVGIDDSKKLTAEQRFELYEKLVAEKQIHYGIGIVSHLDIDKINIYQATIVAMFQAIEKLTCIPDILLVDGLRLPHPVIPCEKIIGGDAKSQSIAAASILAKVTRDRIMKQYGEEFPGYGFGNHKGYSTPEHFEALDRLGPSPIHRMTFEPLKRFVDTPQLTLF